MLLKSRFVSTQEYLLEKKLQRWKINEALLDFVLKKFKKDFWTCLFFLFVCMYGLVIIACVSPIGQSEKNDQNINSKETRRGEGPEYSILFSKCIRKIMFYMFYMYLWILLHFLRHFIVGFFKVSSENITLIWRFVHVHLFVFKRLIIKVQILRGDFR